MHRSQERTWVGLIVAAVLLLAQVPYLLGSFRAPAGLLYIGHPYFNDSTVYINDMLQGAQHGPWWFHDYATTDVHARVFTFHFYLMLGWLGGLLRLTPWTTFHLARAAFGAALLLAVWRLSRPCFRKSTERLALLVVLAFSCGVGMADGQLPISEANTFQSISIFPHFAASILFLVAYYGAFLSLCTGSRRIGWPLAVCVAAVVATGLTHPWNLATMGGVSAAFMAAVALRRGRWWPWSGARTAALAAVALTAVAMAAQQLWVAKTSPLLQVIMGEQNALPVRGWSEWVSFFGWLWLPAIGGAVAALWRWRRSPMVFPALWFAVNGLLLAVPFSFQRRLVEGMHVPVAMLTTWVAIVAARAIARRWAVRHGRAQPSRLSRRIGLAALVTLVVAVGAPVQVRFLTFAYPDPADCYDSVAMREAVAWAGAHLPEDTNVLASVPTSRMLLRQTLLNVYVGHGVRTPDFGKRAMAVLQFYMQPLRPAQTDGFLRERQIAYVFDGPFERDVARLARVANVSLQSPDGSVFQPQPTWDRCPALEVVYAKDGVRILRVKPAAE